MLCMNPEEQAQRLLALEQENQALGERIPQLEIIGFMWSPTQT